MNWLFNKKDGLIYMIAGFCLLLILLIWISIINRVELDKKKTISSTEQRNANLVAAFEQYTIRTISDADAMLQLVRQRYQRDAGDNGFKELLRREFIDLNFFNGVLIADKNGDLVFSNLRLSTDTIPKFADREYFRFHAGNAKDALYINEPIISRILGKPVVVLSRRIYERDGSFDGVIAVHIEPSTFTRFYSTANLRTNDLMSLISPRGITYARRKGAVESFGEDISASPLFVHVERSPVNNYFAADAIHGINTYFSYRKLAAYPIIATVGTAEADVLAEFKQRARRDYLFGSVITFLLIGFVALTQYLLVQRRENFAKILVSEARYRSIFENSLDAILLLEPGGKIEAMNAAAQDLFRIPSNATTPSHLDQLFLSCSPEVELKDVSGVRQEKKEVRFTCSEKSQFTGELTTSSYKDTDNVEHIVIIISDVSQRKIMEERLRNDQRRYQRELTRQIIMAQEREREGIGHELHDNVNQILTSVKLYLEMALKNPAENQKLIELSVQHILECIKEIRNLSRELSAPTLDNQSLIESIKSLLQTVQTSSGLQIRFNHEQYDKPLIKDQRLAIYRILQEQLNNVIKHAKATEVIIDLSQKDGNTYLLITDNGKGFNINGNRNGIGLNNILSRSKIFGGEMHIDSSPGNGCSMKITLPVIAEDGIPQ